MSLIDYVLVGIGGIVFGLVLYVISLRNMLSLLNNRVDFLTAELNQVKIKEGRRQAFEARLQKRIKRIVKSLMD